jgi:protein-tyrosine phosphatase
MEALQAVLNAEGIPLTLVMGADVQITQDLLSGLRRGIIPTLNDSRYFLLEPSHHVPVPGFLEHIENFVNAGYVPVITHPERLHWLHGHYQTFTDAAKAGAWIQLTAGSITGHFGRSAKNWCERFLKDGYTHIIASDAHEAKSRIPILSHAVEETARLLNDEAEAWRMVRDRPRAILDNTPPEEVYAPAAFQMRLSAHHTTSRKPWLRRLFG